MLRTSLIVPVACCAAAVSALAPVAFAVPVQPGEFVFISGTKVGESPWLAGTGDLARTQQFELRDDNDDLLMRGVVRSEHIRSTIFGTQVFQYTIQDIENFRGASVKVLDITLEGFGGVTTNGDWRTGAGALGTAPTSIARDLDPLGNQVRFAFTSQPPREGFPSPAFFVLTNTMQIREDGVAVLHLSTGDDVIVSGLYAPPVFTPPCTGDTNGDGVVNFADLSNVLSNFGGVCE